MSSKRVAILGGTFSPVHQGHMELCKKTLEKNLADEVWLMPCRRNPLKEYEADLDDELRLDLLKKASDFYNALLGSESIKITEIELNMPSPSYTANTMKRLQTLNPDIDFRIIVGSDSYLNFGKWKEHDWLEKNFKPIVYPRPGYEIENLKECWAILEDAELFPVSSTDIRHMIGRGETELNMMPWLKENDIWKIKKRLSQSHL